MQLFAAGIGLVRFGFSSTFWEFAAGKGAAERTNLAHNRLCPVIFIMQKAAAYEPRIAGADSFNAASFASASLIAFSFAAASLAAFAAAERAPRPESRLNCRILYNSAL